MARHWRLAALGLPLLALVACHDEGPAEKAGKSLDGAVQSLKDAVDPPGTGEQIGRALDKAVK
jgi:hypothetical protein